MSSISGPTPTYSEEERRSLLELARASIRHGFNDHSPQPVDLEAYPESLRIRGACFVTLHRHGDLRGCIGSLEAVRPLAEDVSRNAYAAAFQDPRFPPMTEREVDELEIHISVLSPAEPMTFEDEEDLISQLRPGVDGLVLHEGPLRGTFLPSVWESLPNPRVFLAHLKNKAGLPSDYWSNSVKVERYTTEAFGEE